MQTMARLDSERVATRQALERMSAGGVDLKRDRPLDFHVAVAQEMERS